MLISILDDALISIDIVITAMIAPPRMKIIAGINPILRHIFGSAKIPAPKAVAISAKIDPRSEPGPRLLNAFAKKVGSMN